MNSLKNYFFLLLITFFSVSAQETSNVSENDAFNRWSVEVNAGQNIPVRPFATGYYSAQRSKFINFSGLDHYDFGVRYMFSNTFGLKINYGFDQFKEQPGAGSNPFDTKLHSLGLQGVLNFSRLLNFESFTNRFGILAHAGVQVSNLYVYQGLNTGKSEKNAGLMFGITPQIRLASWVALTGDFTADYNIRQHFNWDGSYSLPENNLSGVLFKSTIGFTFYLGSKEKHADWFIKQEHAEDVKELLLARIEAVETLMNDVDRDGVFDYLDAENNTPNGVVVDAKGRFIDKNDNGTPDELEPRDKNPDVNINNLTNNNVALSELAKLSSAEKELVENGLINVFFDVNIDTPNAGSTNNIYIILHYLNSNPTSKAKLIGFADVRGDDKINLELSQRRVKNVYSILISSGISADRLSTDAIGIDTKYSIDSKASLDLARRVSIEIEK
jgi:OOP family OmpA-OmpF porin